MLWYIVVQIYISETAPYFVPCFVPCYGTLLYKYTLVKVHHILYQVLYHVMEHCGTTMVAVAAAAAVVVVVVVVMKNKFKEINFIKLSKLELLKCIPACSASI